MVTKSRKQEIINKFGKGQHDTGCAEVQVAIITEDITNLTAHLRTHNKDVATRRSLLKKVAQRKHLLAYLINNDYNRYKAIIDALGLRK